MKLAVLAVTLSLSSRAFASPDVVDLGRPSRELRPPTTIDIGPITRGPRAPEPPDQPTPPAAPVQPGSVGALGGLVGGVAVLYVVAKFWSPKLTPHHRGGWRSDRTPQRSTGYASLVPDVRKIREVSIVPSATEQSVHTGISLRW